MAGFNNLLCIRRADDQHCPRTSLVCIESSHNRCGGCALSLEYMRSLKSWADDLVRLPNLPRHLPPNALSVLYAAWHCNQPGCQRRSHHCLGWVHASWLVICGEAVLIEECCMLRQHTVSVQGLPIHLDGARVFNAAVALGVDVTAITELVTSVQFCLSKVEPPSCQFHTLAYHHAYPDMT